MKPFETDPSAPNGTDAAGTAEPYRFKPAVFTPAVFTPAAPPSGATYAQALEHAAQPAEAAPPAPPPPQPAVRPQAPPSSFSFSRVGEELVAWFKTLVSAAVYATLIVTFGFQVARVEGQSMAPTLEDQDRLIVNKLIYRLPHRKPQIGEIVMLYYPVDPEKSFVKRIVAEPLDTIRSVNGRVFVNEIPLRDDFIPEEYRATADTWGPKTVPQGFYFVMGDHRNNSSDSRTWDYVPEKYIIGKVELRWWPLNHARLFEDSILPAAPRTIERRP
jgi:signal peptidase I